MPLWWGDAFGEMTAAEKLAAPYIESLASKPISANEIVRTLRESGMGVRRSRALDMVRSVRGLLKQTDAWKTASHRASPAPDLIPEASSRLLRNYSFKVEATGINPLTGERSTQYIWWSTNDPLSVEQVTEFAAPLFEIGQSGDALNLESVGVVQALRNKAEFIV